MPPVYAASAYLREYWPVWAPPQLMCKPYTMPIHTPAHPLPERGACGKQAAVVHTTLNTPPVLYWHVSLGVRARFSSTTASVIALAHVHVPLLGLCPYEVLAANEQQWRT